jgi:glycosyltransferase involved in cell wall biosynthesis
VRERVLVLYLGPVADVARVKRQATFLAADYDVVVAAFEPAPSLPEISFLPLPAVHPAGTGRAEIGARICLRLVGRYGEAYWRDRRVRLWRELLQRALPVDAILVNQLFALPLARSLGADTPVLFDAHEHWTSESASWTRRQRLSMRGAHEWIVDQFVPQTAAMTTVSAGIARSFRERIGISPQLVTNAPYFAPLQPTPVREPIRLLHVGMADPRRRLEDTIAAVHSLDRRFTLDLVLAGRPGYRRRLQERASRDDRVRVLPPVPSDRLLSFANAYDVGAFLLPARFPNQVHVLPNKLFDYIQARLAVAIGPSPEMAQIVDAWDCGIVSSSFTPEAFAEALDSLTVENVRRMKGNADKAARVLNAEQNRETVVSLVRGAIASRTDRSESRGR